MTTCFVSPALRCSWTWGWVEGKTRTTLEALTPEHLPCLVVAPKRVAAEVWPVEILKWRPTLSYALAAGTPTQRGAALLSGEDITIISRDNLADATILPWKTVILDELSSFKNRTTNRWKSAKVLALGARYVWGLTGTPAPNGLMDLWAPVYLLDQGQRLGKNITTYRNRFFRPGRQLANGVITEWIPKPGAAEKIQELLQDICMSMTADTRLDLPPVTYNDIHITLPPAAKKAYRLMRDELIVDMELLGGTEIHTAASAAVMSNKLSQISAGFLYPNDLGGSLTRLHDEKVAAVQEVIDGTGSPVLVFYRYKQELVQLMAALPGARSMDEPNIIKAWNAGTVPVLLAHPASAGHGLNLQYGGHTIVWTTLSWNLEEWQQANARIARQGQTQAVVIHRLMAAPVDQGMVNRLDGKADVQDALRTALESVL